MGSIWALCGFVKKEDYKTWRDFIAFDGVVIWSCELRKFFLFWKGVLCNIRKGRII
jgi:hypothetical protein